MKKLRPWILDHEGLIRMENPSELIFAILYLVNKKRLWTKTFIIIKENLFCNIIILWYNKKKLLKSCYF